VGDLAGQHAEALEPVALLHARTQPLTLSLRLDLRGDVPSDGEYGTDLIVGVAKRSAADFDPTFGAAARA
jgi:hypothetical protein